MSRTKTIVTVLLLLVAVGIAAVLFQMNMAQKDQSQTNSSSAQDTIQPQADTQVPPSMEAPTDEVAATITYDGSSFTSTSTTVKAGQSVKVVNSSNKQLDFDSDPHPVHTDNPELNAGLIAAGQSKTFILTEKGSWGYHNHLNASQKGSLTVE